MRINKLLIAILIAISVIGFSMSSVSAGGNPTPGGAGTIDVYSCGSGCFLFENNKPVNGIPFKDNAWITAFVPYVEITYYDKNNNSLGYNDRNYYAGDLYHYNIPVRTAKISLK